MYDEYDGCLGHHWCDHLHSRASNRLTLGSILWSAPSWLRRGGHIRPAVTYVLYHAHERFQEQTSLQDHVHHSAKQALNRTVIGDVGLLTTWKKGQMLRGGPRTRRFALYKATLECALFLYMVPFVGLVCYWFITAEGFNPFVKATKCVLELPSLFFQFMWAAACTKYWHMLYHDGTIPASACILYFLQLWRPLPRDIIALTWQHAVVLQLRVIIIGMTVTNSTVCACTAGACAFSLRDSATWA